MLSVDSPVTHSQCILVFNVYSAERDMFRPALDIVEEVVRDSVSTESAQFKPKNNVSKRIANQHRAKTRPPVPKEINFEINRDFLHIDDFLVADINMDTVRHIVFSSPFQLDLLKRSKRWFIDGTFKIVGKPFGSNAQLMSINCFVKDGDKKKQFPAVFAIMSRRRKSDYVDVLQAIIQKIGTPDVESFVLDFEMAAWQAVRDLFPGREIKGCVFHWSQAVYRKVGQVGLVTAYKENRSVQKYIKQFLALPFLPASHIRPTFENIAAKANTEKLQEFVGYVRNQWIENSQFEVSEWSIFGHTVRTNNHIEAWHRRLNSKGMTLSFYKLAMVLQQEARHVEISVIARDLESDIKRKYTTIDKEIDTLWTKYRDDGVRTTEFLLEVNKIYKLGKSKK